MNKYNLLELLSTEEKIEESIILEILNNKEDRSYFLCEYKFFNLNDIKILSGFIEFNLRNQTDNNLKSDLIDLSIILNYYSVCINEIIFKDILLNKRYYYKLSILEYFNTFYYKKEIKSKYLKISYFLFNKSTNHLVVFQAAINLLLKNEIKYVKFILSVLSSDELPSYYYYRLANNLINHNQFDKFFDFRLEFLDIINSTLNLKSKQKNELIKKINKKD